MTVLGALLTLGVTCSESFSVAAISPPAVIKPIVVTMASIKRLCIMLILAIAIVGPPSRSALRRDKSGLIVEFDAILPRVIVGDRGALGSRRGVFRNRIGTEALAGDQRGAEHRHRAQQHCSDPFTHDVLTVISLGGVGRDRPAVRT